MKKFLSLVLALIMTMSLVTIGAGATEYRDLTDKDEIQYEEAVAVLNRIGVITGYEDGSFRPETELTRGAAAKIIVSLLIGPEAASNLPNATAPYPDVPASHTFAGVISYCKTAGIISGYGDGTFKPGNSLTGFAFAKMLLGALGYKSEIEGFIDTGWTMNVAKVGNVTGLFDRLDFDGAAAVNREEACQLALNTLKATMVTYGGTTLVTGNQNLAVANTQAMYVTSNNREINANINRRVISAANNEMTLEFGEEHFKDLRLEHDKYDPAYDDFGHPSDEWSYKKVTIGTFKLPADFTYTTQVAYREDSAATKEKALGLRGYDTYSTDHRASSANWSTASSLAGLNGFGNWNSPFADATQITINGWNSRIWDASYTQTPAPATSELDTGKARQDGMQYSYDAGRITAATRDQAPSLSEICDLTDNGVTVEVYVCPVDADFITNVVVTRTQLMKVDRIGSDYVSLERISPDSRDPRRTPSDGLAKITGYNAFSVDVDVVDVKDSNYDPYNALKDLKAGDRVAVVPYTPDEGKTWEAGEVYVPETVSGRLTDVGLYMNTSKRDGNAVSITIGGTKYIINEWNLDMLSVKKPQIDATRKDVTGYLAKDGTVLWATEIGNSDAWMVVGDYYQATNSSGKVVWFVHGWTIGGEEVNIDLGTIRDQAEKYAPGELVHYDLSNGTTGEYQLHKPNANKNSLKYSNKADTFTEPGDDYVETGEGVYNVAQFVKNNGKDAQYSIHPSNSLIPLERYWGKKITTTAQTATGGAIFATESDPDRTITTDDASAHAWTYRSTTYKDTGVKFIYVSFSPVTGEVDYISVRNGVQNVKNEELAYQNKIWNNTATHSVNESGKDWVISPAEAYVNDKGHVEAVVIKSEPTVADLSNVVIVGKVVGTEVGKNTGAEEVSALSNVRTREYWQGPNFSEKKTGSFKNQHNTGDILVIRSTDANGVMDCKSFNSGLYGNRNPDVVWAKGIEKLTSAVGDEAKIAFYIGKNADWVKDQNGDSIKVNITAKPIAENAIMTDKQTEGDELDQLVEFKKNEKFYEGLVKVTSNTKWLDLREEEWGHDVRNLSDLYDLDLDTVEIKVLLNGNDTSDAFRSAYAVIVLNGKPKDGSTDTTTDDGTGTVTYDDGVTSAEKATYGDLSGTVTTRASGRTTVNLTLKKPAWAYAANAGAINSISYDVWVDGKEYDSGTVALTSGSYNATTETYTKSVDINDLTLLAPSQLKGHKVDVKVTEVQWKFAAVDFFTKTGDKISPLATDIANTTQHLSVDGIDTTQQTIKWKAYTTEAATGLKYTIENVKNGPVTGTTAAALTTGETAGTAFLALEGNRVAVTFETATAAKNVFKVGAQDDDDGVLAPAVLNTLNASILDASLSTRDKLASLAISANPVGASVEEGTKVFYRISLTDYLQDPETAGYAVDYELTQDGTKIDGGSREPFVDGKIDLADVEVHGNMLLKVTKIYANKVTFKADSAKVAVNGTDSTLTITYVGGPVTDIRPTASDLSNYIGITDTSGGGAPVFNEAKVVDGKLVITFKTNALADTDVVTVDNIALNAAGTKSLSCTITIDSTTTGACTVTQGG